MKKITFAINYTTNFKPSKNFSQGFNFFKNKNNIVLCKQFIVFLYLIKFILKKNTNLKIFFKPKTSKIETLLRPPYRHKISRHQITLSRYYVLITFFIKLEKYFYINNLTQVFFLFKEISKTLNFFETNICYTHSIKIKTSFCFDNWFKLLNYKCQ